MSETLFTDEERQTLIGLVLERMARTRSTSLEWRGVPLDPILRKLQGVDTVLLTRQATAA